MISVLCALDIIFASKRGPSVSRRHARDTQETHKRHTRDTQEAHKRHTRDTQETHKRHTRDTQETHKTLTLKTLDTKDLHTLGPLLCARELWYRDFSRNMSSQESSRIRSSSSEDVPRIAMWDLSFVCASPGAESSQERCRDKRVREEEEVLKKERKRSYELSWNLSCMRARHGTESFQESCQDKES